MFGITFKKKLFILRNRPNYLVRLGTFFDSLHTKISPYVTFKFDSALDNKQHILPTITPTPLTSTTNSIIPLVPNNQTKLLLPLPTIDNSYEVNIGNNVQSFAKPLSPEVRTILSADSIFRIPNSLNPSEVKGFPHSMGVLTYGSILDSGTASKVSDVLKKHTSGICELSIEKFKSTQESLHTNILEACTIGYLNHLFENDIVGSKFLMNGLDNKFSSLKICNQKFGDVVWILKDRSYILDIKVANNLNSSDGRLGIITSQFGLGYDFSSYEDYYVKLIAKKKILVGNYGILNGMYDDILSNIKSLGSSKLLESEKVESFIKYLFDANSKLLLLDTRAGLTVLLPDLSKTNFGLQIRTSISRDTDLLALEQNSLDIIEYPTFPPLVTNMEDHFKTYGSVPGKPILGFIEYNKDKFN
jgi:hypothetical protein